MPAYIDTYDPGHSLTMTASATVGAGQLVEITGADVRTTVAPAASGSTKWLGVASQDQWTNGQLTVHCGGVQALTAAATITAGAQLYAAGGGQVTNVAVGAATLVGVALTSASAGARVRVVMAR